MLITFAGSSRTKYTRYLLDTIGFLEFDAGQELRTMFLENWLVNLSGEAGRYLEKDLMQEHHNEVLEERVGKQGASWDSKQMRDIHSRTVQHTERIKKEVRPALALLPKGWKHTKPHDRPEIKILLDVYRTTRLHTFRKGRQYRSTTDFEDEFSRGMDRLEAKLEKWKMDLKHSDLMAETLPGAHEVQAPGAEAGDDEEEACDEKAGDDDKEDDDDGEGDDGEGDDGEGDDGEPGDGKEDVATGVPQTEGHCEFVDGELHMVDDENN